MLFAFARSGPIPPNEMGVIPGVAVPLVRLLPMPALLRLLGDRAWRPSRPLPGVRLGHA
ncbi:MAG: hypothetical protein IRZ32_12415 [Solirubrobacteraceae bacterium]|nr:hypothetical protein [Solirubrobacteraceae bacterium]